MKVILETIALPNVNELHPSISAHAIGRALAAHYGEPVTDEVPERISVLLVRLDERERESEDA